MNSTLEVFFEYLPAFVDGLRTTLSLAGLTWVGGISLGVALTIVLPLGKRNIASAAGRTIIFIVTATPMLVLLYWAHFPLQAILEVVIDPFYTALAVLTIINTTSVYNLVGSAMARFPQQYVWAGKVTGMTAKEILLSIRIPLIARQVAPSIITLQAFMLQSTVFSSLISVEDLFRVAQRINAIVYKPIEIYTAMALFYIAAASPLLALAALLEHRFSRDESER